MKLNLCLTSGFLLADQVHLWGRGNSKRLQQRRAGTTKSPASLPGLGTCFDAKELSRWRA
jgi:hypothetical protein